ncbi:hypothetical protein M885DRAFT_622482 [Pelagophyceae sp. CCMP2097]|nr:hypothetical protein M885DRAFT_622482 [Pelagophyceae sp. CCMP2097]
MRAPAAGAGVVRALVFFFFGHRAAADTARTDSSITSAPASWARDQAAAYGGAAASDVSRVTDMRHLRRRGLDADLSRDAATSTAGTLRGMRCAPTRCGVQPTVLDAAAQPSDAAPPPSPPRSSSPMPTLPPPAAHAPVVFEFRIVVRTISTPVQFLADRAAIAALQEALAAAVAGLAGARVAILGARDGPRLAGDAASEPAADVDVDFSISFDLGTGDEAAFANRAAALLAAAFPSGAYAAPTTARASRATFATGDVVASVEATHALATLRRAPARTLRAAPTAGPAKPRRLKEKDRDTVGESFIFLGAAFIGGVLLLFYACISKWLRRRRERAAARRVDVLRFQFESDAIVNHSLEEAARKDAYKLQDPPS